VSTFIWGTVTAVDSLRVQLDGDATELPFTPDSLLPVSTLAQGDRVRCELGERRVVVHGRAGGEDTRSYLLGMAYVWPGTSQPPAYLLPLEGQTITGGLTSYSALAAAHPEWVSGADLVLPDWRGRVPVGHLPGDAVFGTLGAFAGTQEVTLTAAQSGVPAHTHPLFGHAFLWGTGFPSNTVYAANAIATAGSPPSNNLSTRQNYFNVTDNNPAKPAAQGHPNVQPSVVARWCVMAATSNGEYSTEVQQALVADVSHLHGRLTWTGSRLPVFHVTHGTTFSGSGTQTNRLLSFNAVRLNQGGHWDPSDASFTAPVDGLYEFQLGICNTQDIGGPEAGIFRNGTLVDWICIAYRLYNTATGTRKLALNAGDRIQPYWRNNNGYSVVIDGTRSFFSGHLVTAFV
jgi:microcystin-dependent protein